MECLTHEIHKIECPTNVNDFTVFYIHWNLPPTSGIVHLKLHIVVLKWSLHSVSHAFVSYLSWGDFGAENLKKKINGLIFMFCIIMYMTFCVCKKMCIWLPYCPYLKKQPQFCWRSNYFWYLSINLRIKIQFKIQVPLDILIKIHHNIFFAVA